MPNEIENNNSNDNSNDNNNKDTYKNSAQSNTQSSNQDNPSPEQVKVMSVEENLKGIDDLLTLVNKYKEVSEKLSNANQQKKENSQSTGALQDSAKLESLEREIISIKSMLESLLNNNTKDNNLKDAQMDKATKSRAKDKGSVDVPSQESFSSSENLSNLEETIKRIKNDLSTVLDDKISDLKSKIDEVSEFSKKLAKERAESLALKRQELLQRYGLEDFSDFIPDPLVNPEVSEKDIVEAIAKIYNKEVVRSGLGELKKKYDLAKSKENFVDLDKMSIEELRKYRNKLLNASGNL